MSSPGYKRPEKGSFSVNAKQVQAPGESKDENMYVKTYKIVHDNILIPTLIEGNTEPSYLEGEVTSAELTEAGCHVPWLLSCGAIVETGYKPI